MDIIHINIINIITNPLIRMEEDGGVEKWNTVLVEVEEVVEVIIWEWLAMGWATVRDLVEVISDLGRDHEETDSQHLVLLKTLGET